MDLVFDLIEEYTGARGLMAGALVGVAMGLFSCATTAAFQWLGGR